MVAKIVFKKSGKEIEHKFYVIKTYGFGDN